MSIIVATVIGARPQFIKSSILSKEFDKKKIIKEYIINTGQHYDFNMSNIFFNELKLKKPFVNLNINKNSNLSNISKSIIKLEKILINLKADIVVIFGDTDSTISGAITASKLSIPIMHIEAGLRSFDMNMPEEQNRKVSDHLSSFLITPTNVATKNLISEGISKKNIFQFGDIMFDSWLNFKNKIKNKNQVLEKENLLNMQYVLVTIHRQSNTSSFNHIKKIFYYLGLMKYKIIFPIHPRTKKILNKKKYKIPSNILLIDPVGYLDMILLQLNCKFIITDSGGMQKESYFAQKNCYVLRNNTEWIELVKNKHSILIKNDYKKLLKKNKFNSSFKNKYYGTGNTAKKITDLIIKYAKTI